MKLVSVQIVRVSVSVSSLSRAASVFASVFASETEFMKLLPAH